MRRIISFHSQKGGVGKSSLALYSALQLNLEGYTVYLIDFDLTGTSLLDLDKYLENPVGKTLNEYLLLNPFKSNGIDIEKYMSSFNQESLNMILAAEETRAFNNNKINLIAGSSDGKDLELIMPYMYREDQTKYLSLKLKILLNELLKINNESEKLAIIIDNPPSLTGASRTCYNLLIKEFSKNADFKLNNCFVTTTDIQDYKALVDGVISVKRNDLKHLNANYEELKDIIKDIISNGAYNEIKDNLISIDEFSERAVKGTLEGLPVNKESKSVSIKLSESLKKEIYNNSNVLEKVENIKKILNCVSLFINKISSIHNKDYLDTIDELEKSINILIKLGNVYPVTHSAFLAKIFKSTVFDEKFQSISELNTILSI